MEGEGERLRGAAEEGPGLGGIIPRVPVRYGREVNVVPPRVHRGAGRVAGYTREPRPIGCLACPVPRRVYTASGGSDERPGPAMGNLGENYF